MASVAQRYRLPPKPDRVPTPPYFDPLAASGLELAAHRFYADARHVRWLHAVLMTGRFRRVLEIGPYHGFSTTAFLEAARHGRVAEVHLCDIEFTPELHALLHRYGLGDRVTLYADLSAAHLFDGAGNALHQPETTR